MEPLFLGMDIGGTSTRALLVDQHGCVAGVGRADSANPQNEGSEVACSRLKEATQNAWASLGKTFQPAAHAFLGCAGVRSPSEISQLRDLVDQIGLAPEGAVTVENDLSNALSGGLSGRPGIALIAGTGSNCLGRDRHGNAFMCGGWGWLLGDEGSGFGLSLAAIKLALKAWDRRLPPTSLGAEIQDFFSIRDLGDLPSCFYHQNWTPSKIAEFAPLLMRHAAQKDPSALRILEEGADALATLVATTKRQLDFPDAVEVVILGGCGCSGPPYQPLIEKALKVACPKIQLIKPEGSPLAGAAFNALQAGGIHPVPPIQNAPSS